MLWLELTSEGFPEAVKASKGLCLVPIGCLERHGPHLPVGTDQCHADAVARAAADREPAVVFPSYYFGAIHTARHRLGTVALTKRLLLPVLEAVVGEIARNGFSKVLLVNGHGGNRHMIHVLLRMLLEEPHDYVVYATDHYVLEEPARQRWHEMRATDFGGHADEMETSLMLHLRPDLVHMEALTEAKEGAPKGRLAHLPQLTTSIDWYADHPTHYAGDARAATAQKGEFLFQACVDKLVKQMRAIKADHVSPELQREFYRQAERP
jgi:creatinine amidohydrolase